MKASLLRKFLFVTVFMITCISYAQVVFEPAYYIDNSNSKIEGLIQNVEWVNNPSEIKFKANEQSESETITIENIKEFGIVNGAVYSRYDVAIDKSSDDNDNLSEVRSPEFENETLLLKKIIEGKASLYYYSGFGVKRFFYTLDDSSVKQLVYKRFQNSGTEIRVNELYKQELKTDLTCATISESTYKNLNYTLSSLTSFFKLYNECSGSTSVVYNQISKRTTSDKNVRLRIKAGARSNSFSFESSGGLTTAELPNQIGVQVGLEGEFIFQFNRNKWSALLEATYFNYSDEDRIRISSFDQNVTVEYSGLEVGFGARHSLFLENKSRLFINAGFVVPLSFNQSLTQTVSADFEEFNTAINASFGAGFEYEDFSVEVRYNTPRNLIDDINASYASYSITVGYAIF
mmetsp:Transcript_49918/g.99372  ORF Transcript_49918/g.99372 Transcript_49918/m.99372 type:complete len:404 (-) Transcript_49918:88-1299(-)